MSEITIYAGIALVVAQILVAIFTVFQIRAGARKSNAETDTTIPVDAANETTTASLAFAKEMREEMRASKAECAARIKLLEEEIIRLNGRIKELEGKSCP